MKSLTIEVEHLQRGQPRPYAPHTYESRITVTGAKSWDRLDGDRMHDAVKLLVHPFKEDHELADMDGMSAHFTPRLMRLECIESERLTADALGPHRQVWIARVEEPFTD